VRVWLLQHRRTVAAAFIRLWRSPLTYLFNVAVIGITLALPAGLYVSLLNLQSVARSASPEPQLSVFLELDTPRTDAQALGKKLKSHAAVAAVRFIPREQALEEMKRTSGMAGIIEGLTYNPLPDAYVVDARDASAPLLQRLHAEISGWPRVAHVQLDSEWAQRLEAALQLGRVALLLLASLLAGALVAITFNTIRLQVLTQREEIEVAKLIGATDAFIRRSFLYSGALLGLLGGLAAWGVVWGAVHTLNDALAHLSQLYGASWQAFFLPPRDVALLLAFAAALGWMGAWLSVTRHLARVAPR
jgi:cell division transport system permease protein